MKFEIIKMVNGFVLVKDDVGMIGNIAGQKPQKYICKTKNEVNDLIWELMG
jgi:hypothetical protein